MKIRNHKIYKPILTFALFVTCAVCALFAMDGEETGFAELPVSSPEVPAVLEDDVKEGESNDGLTIPTITFNYSLMRNGKGVLNSKKMIYSSVILIKIIIMLNIKI